MVYPIAKRIISPIYHLWIRKVEGTENLPKDKPFIIAANHSSYFDALLLPSIIVPILNKKISALVDSYFWEFAITRVFLESWGAIPVYVRYEEDYRNKNKKSLETALESLRNKKILIAFPEGGISIDGKIKKAYNGTAILALKSKLPVIPVGITGSNKILPKGKLLPRLARCEVKIGKPITFEGYHEKTTIQSLNKTTNIIENFEKSGFLYKNYFSLT